MQKNLSWNPFFLFQEKLWPGSRLKWNKVLGRMYFLRSIYSININWGRISYSWASKFQPEKIKWRQTAHPSSSKYRRLCFFNSSDYGYWPSKDVKVKHLVQMLLHGKQKPYPRLLHHHPLENSWKLISGEAEKKPRCAPPSTWCCTISTAAQIAVPELIFFFFFMGGNS